MASLLNNLLKKVSGSGEEDSSEEVEMGELELEEGEDLGEDEFSDELELEDTEDLGLEEEPVESEEMSEEESGVEEPTGEMEEEASEEEAGEGEVTIDDRVVEEVEELSTRVTDLERSQREMEDDVAQFRERSEKLFKVYEILFRGLNPFDENVQSVDEDLLGEDVFEVFKELTGEGAEDLPYDILGRIGNMEDRIDGLEEKIESGEFAARQKAETEEEVSLEEQYEKALQEGSDGSDGEGPERPEPSNGERPDPKWDIGSVVTTPDGEVVRIADRRWDESSKQWSYKCEPLEVGEIS